MAAERAGYTVTMFVVDTTPPMGTLKTIEFPGPEGETLEKTVTHLEYVLQFAKLKIQEMIFNGRKTDQCGVVTFGSQVTSNIINERNGGYENVEEVFSIAQPTANLLSKLDSLSTSNVKGDAMDGLIVAIQTQAEYLGKKKSWTRKIVLLTNGECPFEPEHWEAAVQKMDDFGVSLTVVGVDFDDQEMESEKFYHKLTSSMRSGVVGNCTFALQEISKPDIKNVRSTLMGNILRLGDVDTMAEEAIEIIVKASKCTSISRAKAWKKFALREDDSGEAMVIDGDDSKVAFAPLRLQTEYYVDRSTDDEQDADGDVKMEDNVNPLDENQGEREATDEEKENNLEKVEREELVRGFKYGSTYVPCPDGQFLRLPTKKGIDICGFFPVSKFPRELSMGEIQYIWAEPTDPQQQVALSSMVQAMREKECVAIARWVSRDDMDPKMGVLYPEAFERVECFLWAQMPFADDIRKYGFASLDKLISKNGEEIKSHPYIPTESQQNAMDDFVDALDLMNAGEKDEEGNRTPWFNPAESYNPALHRTKQAMFHCAVVTDIASNPLPPPHPELLKYFDPPKKLLKRAKPAIVQAQEAFKVKEIPKRVVKRGAAANNKGHEYAADDDEMLLLNHKRPKSIDSPMMGVIKLEPISPSKDKGKAKAMDSGSETEDEEEETGFVTVQHPEEGRRLDGKKPPLATPEPTPQRGVPLPTPARSVSPQIDLGRAPGRIIGTTFPLKDFKKNLEQGDVVSKAVEDLREVIVEVVMRPFASKRHEEMIDCLRALRDTCLKEDEIDAWNAFLPRLKEDCLRKNGNPEFWMQVKDLGRDISLISNKEARKYGGAASVSEKRAEEFIA
ncbi:hypothetical protein AGABI2DRAFT_148177 [Agaricus bisporus var. bisporus H97]|uniref:hypothetical protein n=1 Tax=Agaricus bisporus var. bisporus (strain H97 / ATCC MYA-4626 / FGSC 10389) TaxID=936046 RepID=UPI00029F5B84|nr:hypothetical protein AGABI2DRAFT_148177 [Agaricus bisporus var. bisporus H97]EKV51844.1 hypothetical protein AGABI2DRAFT_148177 [Agaricus bisporus var. bisporus H97]